MQSINGKYYVLVVVNEYSRFTWVKFLRTKDVTPEVIIKLIKQLLVRLNKSVRIIRTNNGTEFINKQLALFLQGTDVPMGGSNCYSLLHLKPILDTYSSQQNSI